MDLLTNLSVFYDGLPTSTFCTLEFCMSDDDTWMSQIDRVALLEMKNKSYLVRKSERRKQNENFYYFYSENRMKILLRYKMEKDKDKDDDNATFLFLFDHSIGKNEKDLDYLTFGLTKFGSAPTKVRTHRTIYEYNGSNVFMADRDLRGNFTFVESNLQSFSKIQNQICFQTNMSIKELHNEDDQEIIFLFCKNAAKSKSKMETIKEREKEKGNEYNGINFASDEFAKYLMVSFRFDKLYSLTDFFIIYDENTENKYMVATLEFECTTYFLYIHKHKILQAAYAFSLSSESENKNKKGKENVDEILTKEEIKCLTKMNDAFDSVFTKNGIS